MIITTQFFFFFFFLIGPLGVESELQLLASATATAPRNLGRVCNLLHSSRQHQTLNTLSVARDRTHILIDSSQVLNPPSHNGTPDFVVYSHYLRPSERAQEHRYPPSSSHDQPWGFLILCSFLGVFVGGVVLFF